MRILLVEDEPGVARFIRKGLEQEGHAVDLADDGDVGLHLALEEDYDLMVLDVMLPGPDGVSICSEVRRHHIATPVLMLTVKSTVADMVAGLDAGADDYLTKPFSFEEFLARVRALTRRRGADMVALELGPLRIDAVAHRVTVDGAELPLRPKEYAILAYLVRNAERVCSRTRILENVWGYDFDPMTNVLDVHIKSLRERLREAGGQVAIRTVRGMGYTVEERS